MNAIAVSRSPASDRQIENEGDRLNILFSFMIVLHFEDVDHKRLPVLTHVAQDYGLSFIECRICRVLVSLRGRQCVPGAHETHHHP